jgi:hypothetical protein
MCKSDGWTDATSWTKKRGKHGLKKARRTNIEPKSKPSQHEQHGGEDDDMDDLEEMRQFMDKKKDLGVNVVRK